VDVATTTYFMAVLALLCLTATVLAAILLVAVRSSSVESRRLWRNELARASLGAGFLVAAASMAGSLYLSEGAKFVPCPLCWYQRICMYPLVLLLGLATLRRDAGIRWYALPLAAIGALLSGYHSWIQAFPPTGGSAFCTLEAPCTERYVWEFGFVSIPFMALCGFLFVIVMMVAAAPEPATEVEAPES
jgi:disulfide bond formation protein DsbB